jgi:hypothetical protein
MLSNTCLIVTMLADLCVLDDVLIDSIGTKKILSRVKNCASFVLSLSLGLLILTPFLCISISSTIFCSIMLMNMACKSLLINVEHEQSVNQLRNHE